MYTTEISSPRETLKNEKLRTTQSATVIARGGLDDRLADSHTDSMPGSQTQDVGPNLPEKRNGGTALDTFNPRRAAIATEYSCPVFLSFEECCCEDRNPSH